MIQRYKVKGDVPDLYRVEGESGLCYGIDVSPFESELAATKAKNKKLREALQNIIDMGHDDDCLMCGRKDYHAKQKLEEK